MRAGKQTCNLQSLKKGIAGCILACIFDQPAIFEKRRTRAYPGTTLWVLWVIINVSIIVRDYVGRKDYFRFLGCKFRLKKFLCIGVPAPR